MVKFEANDIIPAVYRFLLECGLDDAAKLIKKKQSVDNVIIITFLLINMIS